MAVAYSLDLRIRVIEALERGMSVYKAVVLFSVARSTVQRWKAEYRSTGSIKPKKRSSYKKPIITDLKEFSEFVKKNPDRTQAQMAEAWGGIAPRTISSTLKRAKITYKKNLWVQATR